MARPALGKGLGSLLKEASPTKEAKGDESAKLTPGMSSLLVGVRSTHDSLPPAVAAKRRNWVLKASLVVADALLLALVAYLARDAGLGVIGWVLCAISIIVGGWLSCLAARL